LDGVFLVPWHSHGYILGNGRKEGFQEPFHEELIIDIGFAQATSFTPLMDVIIDVIDCGLTKIGQYFYSYIMVY
jgi:hypothetical protein